MGNTGENLLKSQSRGGGGGGGNPPTKSKISEIQFFFEITQFYFIILIYVQNQTKNSIYTYLPLFFRHFKFFWSAFLALRISTAYFFIFRPRDHRDGSFGQK